MGVGVQWGRRGLPLFCNVVGGASVVGVAPKLHGTHMVLPFSHTSCCPRPHPQVSSSMPTPPPPPSPLPRSQV